MSGLLSNPGPTGGANPLGLSLLLMLSNQKMSRPCKSAIMFSSFRPNPQEYLQTHESTQEDMNNPSSQTLLYNLSILEDKAQQAQSLVSFILSHSQIQQQTLNAAQSSVNIIAQDIIDAATSMLPVFQDILNNQYVQDPGGCNIDTGGGDADSAIIELEAADILAKHTHFCQVCGKGFKRGANLRMHMRAHGDEYMTTTALQNPFKCSNSSKKYCYSCPQEGCKWNKNHEKFHPLKSLVCAKNHYKRSHCPKMYVCKRCDNKQFAVLSDLRTHEKHCGDAAVTWQCSCGSTFSRKDKLMGHVALFADHSPAVNSAK